MLYTKDPHTGDHLVIDGDEVFRLRTRAEALAMAIERAKETEADVVIATDPDADRMGVAVRDSEGEYVLLTGNQIGAVLADYRLLTLKEGETIPEEGGDNVALGWLGRWM